MSNNRTLLADYLLNQQSSTLGKNYILNPNCFSNTNNVSVSGTATVAQNTTTPLTAISDFLVSLPNDATSGVTWALGTLDNSLSGQNCMLSMDYTASTIGSEVFVQVLQGANVAVQQQLTLQSTSKNLVMNVPCGNLASATTVAIQNVTGNSGTSTIHVANLSYGKATNLSQVSQAQLIGQVNISGCSGPWGTTSTSLAAFSPVTGCVYTASGSAAAPSTMIPGISFASLPPGDFVLKYEGQIGAYAGATAGASFQFWDGSKTANEISRVGNAGTGQTVVVPGIMQTISYNTPQSNVTFSIRGATDNSSAPANVFGVTGTPGVISVYYYPSQSQLAVNSNTSYPTFSVNTSTTAGSPTQNLIYTTAANDSNGGYNASTGAYTIPIGHSGMWHFDATVYFGGTSVSAWIEDNGTTFCQTSPAGAGTGTASCDYPVIAGDVIKVFLPGPATATGGGYLNNFSGYQIITNQAAPILVGSVTSSGSGQYRSEFAYINTACTSSPCTMTSNSAGISSVTRSGVGSYVINFPSGQWSAPPACNVTAAGTSQGNYTIVWSNGNSTASASFTVSDASGGGNQDASAINIICMGSR